MTEFDKLGRKKPQFDRSAANKKGAQTRKQRYGEDVYSKMGKAPRKTTGRGNFGKLKAEDPTALAKISAEANEKKRARKVQADVRGTEK